MRVPQLVILFFLLGYSFGLSSQNTNGKYFYRNENIAGNFFDKPEMKTDSVFLFYEINGDTITYWTVGMSTPYTNKELKKIQSNEGYGKYLQKGLTLNDDRTIIHRLSPTKFLLKSDSLFQWTESYLISEDSIQSIVKNNNASTANDIIKKNTEKNFKLIFSPNFFRPGVTKYKVHEENNYCGNTIHLDNYWIVDGKRFYQFHIENNCGVWKHHWGFTLSENFEFVSFGGYRSIEAMKLSKDNSQIKDLKGE